MIAWVWDPALLWRERQCKVTHNGNKIAEYCFDGEGKRVKKKVFDEGDPVNPTEETVFVYSNGKFIAEYSTAQPPPNPTTSYTATDQLGSPRVITNALGGVVSRRDFKPFGEQVAIDGTYRSANLTYNFGDGIRQKFTGYQKDEETQLDFAEARMYESRYGRFTALDPLLSSGNPGKPQTFNRYLYVVNSPLSLTDPDGSQIATFPGRWAKDETEINIPGLDEKVPWIRFHFFMGDITRETYNGANGTNFQWFDNPIYLYGPLSGHQRFAVLERTGIYSEGEYIGPAATWDAMTARQSEGDFKAVNNMMRSDMILGLTESVGSKDDNVHRMNIRLGVIPFVDSPATGIFNSGGKFASLNEAQSTGEVAHHLPQDAFNRSIGLSRADGPALGMTIEDHSFTRTFAGRGRVTMINDAGLNARERMFLDIVRIRQVFGRQYNKGLLQAIDYSRTLPEFQLYRPRYFTGSQ